MKAQASPPSTLPLPSDSTKQSSRSTRGKDVSANYLGLLPKARRNEVEKIQLEAQQVEIYDPEVHFLLRL